MSCTLLEFCRLQELETVRDYLFQSQKSDPEEETKLTGKNKCPVAFNLKNCPDHYSTENIGQICKWYPLLAASVLLDVLILIASVAQSAENTIKHQLWNY